MDAVIRSLYDSIVSRDFIAHCGTGSIFAIELLLICYLPYGHMPAWAPSMGFPFLILLLPALLSSGIILSAIGNAFADKLGGALSKHEPNLQELYKQEMIGRSVLPSLHASSVGRANAIRYLYQSILGLLCFNIFIITCLCLLKAFNDHELLGLNFSSVIIPFWKWRLLLLLSALDIATIFLWRGVVNQIRRSYLNTLRNFCEKHEETATTIAKLPNSHKQ